MPPAAPPNSKQTGASKVQGNFTDRGHITFQPPVYIKSTQCLAVWQKCSPLPPMHSSTRAVSCHSRGVPRDAFGSMDSEIPAEKFGKCQCETHRADSILYQILKKEHGGETKWHQQYHGPHRSTGSRGCSCVDRRRVVLKTPEATCRRASEVLSKTLTFIRNLPSFYHMPWEDQVVLIQQNWAPLFVLGLAQEGVDFDLREISAPSLLKRILLNQSLTASNELGSSALGASLAEVRKLKNLLWKFWDLDISAKEYAYLKGIILFNPGCHVLKCLSYVQTLQQEAQQALMDFIAMMFNRNLGRFAWILQLIASLQDIDADAIEELFFRPVLGEATLNVLHPETLYIKPHLL